MAVSKFCKFDTYRLLGRTALTGLGSIQMLLAGLIKKILINNILENILSVKTTVMS